MTTAYDYLFKFTIIGDSGVGKSCLMMRFADDTFNESFITTIGVDFRFRTINVDDKVVKLQIWDTAGQEKFKTITSSYYRNAHAVMIVYDVSDRKSFDNIESWLGDIEKFCPDKVSKMIIGNKCDIEPSERQVELSFAQSYAENLKIPYMETSAKTADNVEHAFYSMVQQLIKNKVAQGKRASAIDINSKLANKNSGCACLLI
eukprot:CAMPEP_0197056828 /NCGR_PEP_ID=MMETSP1384-20130603/90060_1 /TAXON_ID=29189 /ORGANISM="Ammonia sp." /LENGTH=202 /DNA_ID=CAMNT_0042491001 /DNA_START=96 /DNA_END=704 /DNA_ORIENTATION=+